MQQAMMAFTAVYLKGTHGGTIQEARDAVREAFVIALPGPHQ